MPQFYMRNIDEEPQKGDTACIHFTTFSKEQNCYIEHCEEVELLCKLVIDDSDDIFWLVKGYEEHDKIQIVTQGDLINVGYYGD